MRTAGTYACLPVCGKQGDRAVPEFKRKINGDKGCRKSLWKLV